MPLARPRLLSTLVLQHGAPKPIDTRWRGVRWKSTETPAVAAVSSTPAPDAAAETASSSIDALAESLAPIVGPIPPLQAGDMAALGLCNWTPAGAVQYSFEAIHLLTGLPWFYTFVAATVLWRLVTVPFAIIGARHAGRMRPIQSKITASTEKLQEARRMGDTVGMQRASLEIAKIRKEAGASMLGMLAPMIQLPVSLGMFFGIKRMCELPLIQLTQSGFEWLPDLTQPGPYYILPILVAASGNALLLLSARDMDSSRPSMGHLLNIFRVVSVLAIYWMQIFPSGLTLSLLITSLLSIGQMLLLRAPAVRQFFKIPPLVTPPGGEFRLPRFRDTIRYYLNRNNTIGQGFLTNKAGTTAKVTAYVPPKAPTPVTAPRQARTLDELAQQAQSKASVKSSSLFEAAPVPASKKKKAKAKK
ncbi:60Kd inner membrane protein-domain-containing protein [Mycena amicta]|nr:60Kd inner membrane protein-domain-containing protein [Mycena amicta]